MSAFDSMFADAMGRVRTEVAAGQAAVAAATAATASAQPIATLVRPNLTTANLKLAPGMLGSRIDPGLVLRNLPADISPFIPKFPTPAKPIPTAPPAISPGNPFGALPHPNPGDRIRSEDFRRFSECLEAIQDACVLSASLFGHTLAEAKPLIAVHQYAIHGVMSVFGTMLASTDASLDERRVVHVAPIALGERALFVVVTEAVETRRLAPNVMGLTYTEAMDRLRSTVGDATFPQMSISAGQLVGRTLGDAASATVQPHS